MIRTAVNDQVEHVLQEHRGVGAVPQQRVALSQTIHDRTEEVVVRLLVNRNHSACTEQFTISTATYGRCPKHTVSQQDDEKVPKVDLHTVPFLELVNCHLSR